MRDLAIRNTHPTVVTINGETNALDVNGNDVALNEDIIRAEIVRLQAAYNAIQYQRDRAAEYPPIEDQLDMIFHAGLGGDEFQSAIKAIKDKYPKMTNSRG